VPGTVRSRTHTPEEYYRIFREDSINYFDFSNSYKVSISGGLATKKGYPNAKANAILADTFYGKLKPLLMEKIN
jgi:hypothetical protein